MALPRERLLEIFAEELEDRRRDIERGLLALEAGAEGPSREQVVTELFRAAHSIKGAAHSVGAGAVAASAHRLEDLFAEWRDSRRTPGSEQLRSAFDELDELVLLVGALGAPAAGPVDGRGAGAGVEGEALDDRDDRATPDLAADPLRTRVTPRDLDSAVAAAGELAVALSHGGEITSVATRTASEARRLERDVEALRTAGPAVSTPSLTSTSVDRLAGRIRELASAARDMERAIEARQRRLDRTAADVQHAVHRLGLVRFEEVCTGLDRIVRDVAEASGKRARLRIETGATQLDRSVAAVLRDPLVQLVRNAVDHGLETPDVRARAHKPPEGRITVTADLEAGELVVTVADDGAGVDRQALRRAAIEKGVEAPEDDDELLQLVFEPGVSTARATSRVSGRGVGMDVVRSSVESVGGSVELRSDGSGLRVHLRLPLTLSTVHAVLLRAARETVALPVWAVEGVHRIAVDEVAHVGGRAVIARRDRTIPVADLAAVLGFTDPKAPTADTLTVVVVQTPDGDAALVVDAVVGEQEVWLRPLPERLRGAHGVLGGAVLADGECILLLSPPTWVRQVRQQDRRFDVTPSPAAPRAVRIVLAEDTATTRMLEQTILESAGYEVLPASDGQEAWTLLEREGAELVVTDVDMPHVDGFELCRRIRSSPRFADLPVVLVTSLASDEDRSRGLEVGADAYFVKSSFDQGSLIDMVARLL